MACHAMSAVLHDRGRQIVIGSFGGDHADNGLLLSRVRHQAYDGSGARQLIASRAYFFNYVPTRGYESAPGLEAFFPGQCLFAHPIETDAPSEMLLIEPQTTGSEQATPTVELVVLDRSEALVATPWLIIYEVASNGTECAPACDTPWKSGDPFPYPTSTPDIPTSEEPYRRDSSWDMTPMSWFLFLGVPLIVVACISGCVAVCCWDAREKKKERRAALQAQYMAGTHAVSVPWTEPPPAYHRT